jgi:hypothetical protein
MGQRAAVLEVARWELLQGDADSAALLLDDLDEVPHALTAKLEEVRRAKAAEAERLARLARMEQDLDKETGARTRAFIGVVLGAAWVVSPLLRHNRTGWIVTSYAGTIGADLLQVAAMIGFGIWARESLTKTLINRRIGGIVLLMAVAQTLLGVGMWMAGFENQMTHWLHVLVWFITAAALAITVETGVWPSAALLAILFLVTARHREWVHCGTAIVNAFIVINLLKVWSPKQWRERVQEFAESHRR